MEPGNSDRVPTGIDGFDDICGGGLMRDNTYLLAGTAGCGKTLFGLQFLYNGATRFQEPGIFLATEERPVRIRRNAAKFGFNFEALENENKIAFIDASSTKIGMPSVEKYVDIRRFDMDNVIDQLVAVQEDIGATRCVVDSSTSISYMLNDPGKVRVEMLRLGSTMEVLGLTSILIGEMVPGDPTRGFYVESFLTDGVIVLYNERVKSVRLRSVEVYKMRGSEHSNKIHPVEITPRGLLIHPHEEVYGE
ncbi:MAG: circadian clock protein KaiC [Euryarchaeota archaeon]|nr:circadian clock protein KaiC [Euryarchaeota archaeon]